MVRQALPRIQSPQILGTRVLLLIGEKLTFALGEGGQAHDNPVLYTSIFESSDIEREEWPREFTSLLRRAEEALCVSPARFAGRGLEADVIAREAHARAEDRGPRGDHR